MASARCVGLVLAAGGGMGHGVPAAMERSNGSSWCALAVDALVEGGCDDVVVVLGALAESAVHLVPPRAGVVLARDWADGVGASLRAGLRAVGRSGADRIVVTLADLPGLSSEAVARVVEGTDAASVRRATYRGAPGHPAVIGVDHWPSFTGTRRPDDVLSDLGADEVDCTGLGDGGATAPGWMDRAALG